MAAFDYDGTLAPIAATPSRAAMRARTRELFRRVSDCFPTVVISGRVQADLAARLGGIAVFAVIGNHGIEPWANDPRYRRQARQWMAVLPRAMGPVPGAWVEDKGYSVAVHYRQAADVPFARRRIARAISGLGDVRVVPGKRVYNLLPRDAPHKGAALERARAWLGCDSAIYVGDDETDEDVFGLRTEAPLLTVKVGGRGASRAAFRLRSQRMIDDLLDVLVRLRREPWPAALPRA
jgi:trehalose 6-phosphate phosphatase